MTDKGDKVEGLGIAGGPVGGVVTVQGDSGMVAIAVDTELPVGVVLADAMSNAIAPPRVAGSLLLYNPNAGALWWDRARAASGDGSPATGIQNVMGMLSNGVTLDRMREPTADALAVAGLQAAGVMLWNGASWDRIREPTADAVAVAGLLAAAGMIWNGATWDRVRGTAGAVQGYNRGADSMLVSLPAAATQAIVTFPATVGKRWVLGTAAFSVVTSAATSALHDLQILDGVTSVWTGRIALTAAIGASKDITVPPGSGIRSAIGAALVVKFTAAGPAGNFQAVTATAWLDSI